MEIYQAIHVDRSISLQFSGLELLHGCAGVCSVCLPDMELGAIYNSLTAQNCTTAIILASQESQSMLSNLKYLFSRSIIHCYAGVLDYRLQCGVPALPVDAPVTAKANGSRLDESAGKANGSKLDESGEEEIDDSNPFASIVSEGESSGEEEEEGESTEHGYTKQQEIFIQEAMSRRTIHSQHCKYTDMDCTIIVDPHLQGESSLYSVHGLCLLIL